MPCICVIEFIFYTAIKHQDFEIFCSLVITSVRSHDQMDRPYLIFGMTTHFEFLTSSPGNLHSSYLEKIEPSYLSFLLSSGRTCTLCLATIVNYLLKEQCPSKLMFNLLAFSGYYLPCERANLHCVNRCELLHLLL